MGRFSLRLLSVCVSPPKEPNQKNLSHVFMHLTNYSLNVQSDNFVHSDSQSTGSKRTFSSVLYRLASKGVDIKKVWSDVISLVIKTVIALVPELKVHYQADIPPGKPGPTCFQVGRPGLRCKPAPHAEMVPSRSAPPLPASLPFSRW